MADWIKKNAPKSDDDLLLTGGEELGKFGESSSEKADREGRNDATKRKNMMEKGNATEKKARRMSSLYNRSED